MFKVIHSVFSLVAVALITTPLTASAQSTIDECFAVLERDTLIVENNCLQYKWLWNRGEIIPVSISDKLNNRVLTFANEESDCRIARQPDDFIENLQFEINHVGDSYTGMESLEVEIINQYADFQQRRKIRVFPNLPTISFDYAYKYSKLSITAGGDVPNIIDYHFSQKHWRCQNVEFVDMTDHNDNLMFQQSTIPYNDATNCNGNLLWMENLLTGFRFFILKEAPNNTSQIAYPGYDFAISNTRLSIPISGVEEYSCGDDFMSAYTITLGVLDKQTNGRASLRRYLKQSVPYDTLSHDMILMNTWGDRGRDGRICEQFIVKEITKAAKLGVTHFQIDDGWQQGISANSATQGDNNNWDSWSQDSWKPNKERFPNGLEPIVKIANKNNIKLGLWFNPSKADDYKRWEHDVETIINLYKTYGIKYYKIDGVSIPTKKAAVNFEKFLTQVKEQSDGEVFFNLDLTAGVRGGYFSYRYAGNLFLENRYTDFKNYYPYKTLRNLWMLSQYFPPELLQIEFLNKWRNENLYSDDDTFAPSHYNMDYLFAIAMVAQPLAWYESTGLPAEADDIAHLINKYKAIQPELHSGVILPIGDEPSGRSWTGFQAILDDTSGYILIFRENSESAYADIETYLEPCSKVRLTAIAGTGNNMKCNVDNDRRIKFGMDKKNSFVLYKYVLK